MTTEILTVYTGSNDSNWVDGIGPHLDLGSVELSTWANGHGAYLMFIDIVTGHSTDVHLSAHVMDQLSQAWLAHRDAAVS